MSSSSQAAPSTAVPPEHQQNFRHLYADIAWYGVLNGSAIAFIAVYAARLGATGLQIGLLSAAPGVVTLMIALPSGQWLKNRPISHSVFWSSVFFRFFYLTWAFLPFLLNPQTQLRWLILITFLMSIPGTVLAIGFNGLFAAAVPPEWRGHVAGTRNAAFAIASIITSILCGTILAYVPFPYGFQLVFLLGFIGAAMSSVHLYFVRPLEEQPNPDIRLRINDLGHPGSLAMWFVSRSIVAPRALLSVNNWRSWLSLELVRGPFGWVIFLLFGFHVAQFLAVPLFPLQTVNIIGLSDQEISLGNGTYYLAMFVVSTQLALISHRLGHQRTLALGIILLASYPLLLGFATGLLFYLLTSMMGGIALALVNAALGNYLLERIPEENRAPHLAWYNLSLNAAVLLGSLVGPLLASWIGLFETLVLATVLRTISGVVLWRWG